MKSAWILGGKGFIGRHLSVLLAQKGVDVTGFGHGEWLPDEARSWGMQHWKSGEIDCHGLMDLASERGIPDTIFHLAGGSLVMASVERPFEDFQKTVISTAETLEWVRTAAPDTAVVFASSAAVYGNEQSIPIREDSSIAPCSPYGYHKRMAELLIESYARRFGVRVSVVRLFSVYGEGLRKQLLWDLCGRCASNPRDIQLQGTGNEVRDWLWVEDAASYLSQASGLAGAVPFLVNGGTGQPCTVREISESVIRDWGLDCQVRFSQVTRPGDPAYLVADNTWGVECGFKAEMDWSDGIRRYVKWFKKDAGLDQ